VEKEGEERDGWRDHGGTVEMVRAVMGDNRVASDPTAALVMAPTLDLPFFVARFLVPAAYGTMRWETGTTAHSDDFCAMAV
jgi:hypothetical protein